MSHGTTRMRGIGFAALIVLAFASPIVRAEIKIDYSYVDKKSEAYNRFKGWVDTALGGNPGYEFSAIDAVTMFRLTNDAKYCDYAVQMMQKQADDAVAAIAAGKNPEVAGDSYLQSGPMISALALTYDACRAQMNDAQRTQWSGYAERTIANIWSPNSAKWGERSAPWTGWSIDNPGNNYYYSFVEATMYWGLASNNETWMKILARNKLPPLESYFAKLKGGGSQRRNRLRHGANAPVRDLPGLDGFHRRRSRQRPIRISRQLDLLDARNRADARPLRADRRPVALVDARALRLPPAPDARWTRAQHTTRQAKASPRGG